jgi:predicted AAA+ superfamily ATPase
MDIVERLRAREHFDTWNNEFVSKEAADEIERLREVLGMWLRYSKSDYDDHAQMIIDWSKAEAATKAALKEKE